jgi:hypothetical protein
MLLEVILETVLGIQLRVQQPVIQLTLSTIQHYPTIVQVGSLLRIHATIMGTLVS